jgi:hypothetical protein
LPSFSFSGCRRMSVSSAPGSSSVEHAKVFLKEVHERLAGSVGAEQGHALYHVRLGELVLFHPRLLGQVGVLPIDRHQE